MINPAGSSRTARFIGQYRIIALLGVGASSTVYRAVRPGDSFHVAIKLLADNHSMVAESRRRFSEEWTLLAQIRHPSIATIYEVGETEGGQPFMVLELANRGDLNDRVKDLSSQGYRVGEHDIWTVAKHLRDALSELHRHAVVHRDISPSNILLCGDRAAARPTSPGNEDGDAALVEPDERLLLSDLGFAKRLADASGLTRGGGTEGFAAPEQRDSVSIVDRRADLYSASAIIGWLTDGSALNDRLSGFVAVGTAVDPDDRYQTIDEWYEAFHRAMLEDPEARPRPPRFFGRRLLVAGAAAVGALLAGLAGWAVLAAEPDRRLALDQDALDPETELTSTTVTASVALAITTQSSLQSSRAEADGAMSGSTSVSSTVPMTTASTSTSTTTEARPTTSDPFPFSPRAYIERPVEDELVAGDLEVRGTARAADGVALVQLVLRQLNTNAYWDPTVERFQPAFVRFEVAVAEVGQTETPWSYVFPADQLAPGKYRLRAWARDVAGSGDPVGEFVVIERAS